MTVRCLLAAVTTLMLAGCQTLGIGDRNTITLITSDPSGALVRVEGFGECETPCRVEINQPQMVTIAKAGFLAQRFQIVPGKKTVAVQLQLAAPTKGVDANTLPEL